MPSGCCILGIGILGVAIREKSRHVCLLGVAFWVFAFWGFRFVKIPTRMPSGGRIWVFAFWGLRFVKIPTRMPSGVAFWVFEFWGLRFVKIPTRMPSGGRILGICILGVAIRKNFDTYAFWGLHFGYLHSGGCDS